MLADTCGIGKLLDVLHDVRNCGLLYLVSQARYHHAPRWSLAQLLSGQASLSTSGVLNPRPTWYLSESPVLSEEGKHISL